MNTLRDKIYDAIFEIESERGGHLEYTDEAADLLQSIAEDFAVKFAEWVSQQKIKRSVMRKELYYWPEHQCMKRNSGFWLISEIAAEFRDNFYSPNIKEGE